VDCVETRLEASSWFKTSCEMNFIHFHVVLRLRIRGTLRLPHDHITWPLSKRHRDFACQYYGLLVRDTV
jgi:hypothetical protein